MNKTARIIKVLLVVVILNVAALALTQNARAAAGNTQICNQNSTCTVGEFLYDDSYNPIATASCTFSSKYPNGDVFINSQIMDSAPENDGWYSYDVTATGSAGIYRSTICCTVDDEYLCLDKSFEVSTSAASLTSQDISDSVWNADRADYVASGTFGEALQNIVPSANEIAIAVWGYSSRSLSTFGSLVSDIWSSTTRLLTGVGLTSGQLATKSDVDSKVDTKIQEVKDQISTSSASSPDLTDLKAITQRTNNLLEQLVNEPIIETTVEEVPDLQAKLKNTETMTTKLFIGTQSVNSKAGLLKLRWDSLKNGEIIDGVQELIGKIGGENDSSNSNSIFGYISFLEESWDWNTTDTISAQAKAIKDVLASIQKDVERSGKSKASYKKLVAAVSLIDKMDSSVGESSDKSTKSTLFGKLKETKLLASSLDKSLQDFEAFVGKWDVYKLVEKQRKLSELAKGVVAVNRIPSVNKSLLSTNLSLDKDLRNKSYFAMGILSANKKLLAKKSGTILTNTWLEIGSMVFKTLVSNPSTVISQKADIKYYLPPEIREEDIIETDDGLTVKYDTEKDQYYVAGAFTLAPSETKTVSVRTEDIWVISTEEVATLKKQAEELARPLEKTSFFAQGVTITSDINVSLDKILELAKVSGTPEAKIRAFREAQIELNAVNEKMEKLKDLVTQAGSAGTLFGFVGGAQTLAVWGLIIILSIGFVFLALYMKLLVKNEKKVVVKKPTVAKKAKKQKEEKKDILHKPMPRFKHSYYIVLMFLGIGVSLGSGVMLGRSSITSGNEASVAVNQVATTEVLDASTSAEGTASGSAAVEKVTVVVPEDSSVNVRSKPSLDSDKVTKIKETTKYIKLDADDEWTQIAEDKEGDPEAIGWVYNEFVEEEGASVAQETSESLEINQSVVVDEDLTGGLRVREVPVDGEVLTKVYAEDIFPLLTEEDGWYKIELKNGTVGWISNEFASLE